MDADTKYAVLADQYGSWQFAESGLDKEEARQYTNESARDTHGGNFIYGPVEQCNYLIGESPTETGIDHQTGKAFFVEDGQHHLFEDNLYAVVANTYGVWKLQESGVNKETAEEITRSIIEESHGGEVVYGTVRQINFLIDELCTETGIDFKSGKAFYAKPSENSMNGYELHNFDGSPTTEGKVAIKSRSQGASVSTGQAI